MILYNVTVSIDETLADEWLSWMRLKHVPDVMATGCFIESRISRVQGEEAGGFTFAISYLCRSSKEYDNYQDKFAQELQKDHESKFGGRFVAFRTLLTVIDEFRS